jgi:hypothetical protein
MADGPVVTGALSRLVVSPGKSRTLANDQKGGLSHLSESISDFESDWILVTNILGQGQGAGAAKANATPHRVNFLSETQWLLLSPALASCSARSRT